MTEGSRTFHIADLISSRVIDADGRDLGQVVDISVSADGRYEVLGLLVGSTGWLDRLDLGWLIHNTSLKAPDHVPWSRVERIDHSRVYLRPEDEGRPRD